MIKATVNGEPRELPDTTTILAFLETLDINLRMVAVAHNGEVLRRDELPNVTIQDGDRIEIVQAVGGG